MSQPQDLRPVEFIDNYFPVIDGVTETVHEYAKRMNALVVCPAMEKCYREKYDFPYELQTARTIRVPFSRYASAVPALDGKLPEKIAEYRRQLRIYASLLRGLADGRETTMQLFFTADKFINNRMFRSNYHI